VAYIGGDGGKDAPGTAGNNTDPDYTIVSGYVPNCARGGSQGAIMIIKNP
jgi:hypothetical protein